MIIDDANHIYENSLDYSRVEELYRYHRYMDAFGLVKHVLADNQKWAKCNARQLMILARLAGRLGCEDLTKALYQVGRDKYPQDPLVLFYAGRSEETFRHLFFQLKQTRGFPVEDLETRYDKAVWYASSACLYASFRHFSTALGLIAHAKSQGVESAWARACEAHVYYLSDQWDTAKQIIDDAWQMLPGHPQTASTLGLVYSKLGLIEQACHKILEVAVKGQSYHTLMIGLWYLCALAEREPREKRILLADKAGDYAKNLNRLAPLADKETLGEFADLYIDIAWLKNDMDAMQSQVKSVTHPFYKTILENQASNPGKPFFQAPYEKVYQKHNTCLPASTAAVLGGQGCNLDVDALSREMTYQGTAIWRMRDWLIKQGYCVKPFIVTPFIARQLLKNRCAFVYMQKAVDFYHALAAVGWDEATDVLFLHDPASIRMDRILMKKTGSGQAPFGPEAIAIVKKQDSALLDIIPKELSAPFNAFLDYKKILETTGPKKAETVLRELTRTFPGHPFTFRLESIHLGHMGKPGQAIEIQKALLKKYPRCELLKNELLTNLHSTGNSALQRSILAQWVKQKKLPGIKAQEAWRYPPAEYVSRYTDFLGLDKSGFEPSIQMLLKALGREPFHAGAYHILGDIYTRAAKFDQSTLPYYCAACLELENHHYTRAYSDALHKQGRGTEGLDFLKQRVQTLENTIEAGNVRVEYISALEDYGFPDQAMDEMDRAGSLLPRDPDLHQFAVQFWGRMGFSEKAHKSLACVKEFGSQPAYYSAHINYSRQIGDFHIALAFAEKWLRQAPDNPTCLRAVADLVSMTDGRGRGLELTRKWMETFVGNDSVENLHYDYLDRLFKYQEKIDLLKARIQRNVYDGWAHRELGYCLLDELKPGQKSQQQEMLKELDAVIEQCREICPDNPGFYILLTQTHAYENDIEKAIQYAVKAFEIEPEYVYAYRRAWDLAHNYPDEKQKELFLLMEKNLFRCSGFLNAAREIIFLYAKRFGANAAHDIVDNWHRRLPNDPEIIEAKADLLLEYGQGRSDAKRALELLETEIKRFPNHQDLHLSLAQAYRALMDEEKWLKVTHEILDRFPLNSHMRRKVAQFYQMNGQTGDALDLLKKGIELAPMDDTLRLDYILLLFQLDRHAQAKQASREAMAFAPESVYLRDELVQLLFDHGEDELAVDIARGGVKVYPDGSALWLSLANALWRSRFHTDMEVVESYFNKALEFTPDHFEAADNLCRLLTIRQRYDEARTVISAQKPMQNNPAPIETRLAWITREQGQKKEAKTQLAQVLVSYPRSRWGWRMLLEWITEDEDWDLAKTMLKKAPPLMLEDPVFTGDKLMLLSEAELEDADTEAQWQQILDNFVENERIYTQRFDLLWEKKELSGASDILKKIERFHPDSPYILARKASFCLARDRIDDAFKAALKVWHMPGAVGDWCKDHIWDAFKEKGCLKDLIQTALDEWEQGQFLEPDIFHTVITNLEEIFDAPGPKYKFMERFGVLPAQVSRLNHLLTIAPQRDTPDGYYTYSLLDKLDSLGRKKSVIRFGKTHKDFCFSKTQVWQIIGHALLTSSLKNNTRARRWFSIWEQQDGCDLWAVSNYVISIECGSRPGSRKNQQLIYDNCEKAVRILPRDHTVQFMVAKQCQAALRLGMDKAFIDCTTRYENLLSDRESGYWLNQKDSRLPEIIMMFHHLLQSRDNAEILRNANQFFIELPEVKVSGWVRTEFFKRIRPHVGRLNYIRYRLNLTVHK